MPHILAIKLFCPFLLFISLFSQFLFSEQFQWAINLHSTMASIQYPNQQSNQGNSLSHLPYNTPFPLRSMQMPLFVLFLFRLVAKFGFPLLHLLVNSNGIEWGGKSFVKTKLRLLKRGSEKGKASCFAQDWIWKVQHSAVGYLNRSEVWCWWESREKFCHLQQTIWGWNRKKKKMWILN